MLNNFFLVKFININFYFGIVTQIEFPLGINMKSRKIKEGYKFREI